MPELPEVETIARQLDEKLGGKEVDEVEVLRERSFKGDEKLLKGQEIEEVGRRGKLLIIEFKNWDRLVLVHLKMTGQLVWRPGDWEKGEWKEELAGGHPSDDWVNELPSSHTRVIWSFKDDSKLFFNDMRVFGWMKIEKVKKWEEEEEKMPPDVVDDDFTLEYFRSVLSSTRKMVKTAIMDQKKMGGVGNIYASDALWKAKIHPEKRSNNLSDEEMERLYEAVVEVINKGIKMGGATYSDFKDTQGLGGSYQEHFLVYDRDGEKCKRCGEEIKKIKVGGRGTYFCPVCQSK